MSKKYTTRCKRCKQATTHDNEGCIECAKKKELIVTALKNAKLSELSLDTLIDIVKVIKRKRK